MYRQANRTEFEPGFRRRGANVARGRAELVIEPREAPIPGQTIQSAFVLPDAHDQLESKLIMTAAGLAALVVLAIHAKTLMALGLSWWNEPGLACLFAVPAVAAWLLWRRRHERPVLWQSNWWGLGMMLVGGSLEVMATWGYYFSLRPLALLLTLAGICVLAGGRAAWHWCWPAVMFLAFALPLPVHLTVAGNPAFQRWTSAASAYLLVAGGIPAISAGGELILGDTRLGTADALSGLATVVISLAVCTAVALIVQARTWERWLIVLSALPIAMICNVIRLTLAASLQELAGPAQSRYLLGDVGGLLTVLLALCLVYIERNALRRALPPIRARASYMQGVGVRN